MNTNLQIIKKYKLEPYFKVLIEENEGNNNPYHNFYHTITVLKNVYFISKSENLKDENIRLLLIAALFHDFNHSGGKFKDDGRNIELALNSVKKYSKESDNHNKFIENTIKCTKFPYNKEDKLSINQQIIRDSDLLQSFEDNYIQQCLFGLSSEMGDGKVTKTILENQIKFLSSVEIFTEYAKKKYEEKLPSVIEDCKYIIKVLEL